MVKTYAVVLGAVLVLLGIGGLLLGDGVLLGLLNVDVLEDLVHVVSGACCSLRVCNATRGLRAA